jgi:hypothetical protein
LTVVTSDSVLTKMIGQVITLMKNDSVIIREQIASRQLPPRFVEVTGGKFNHFANTSRMKFGEILHKN